MLCVQDNLHTELAERDWGVQQVLTSANWGGVVGNFFTGGLNLQVRWCGCLCSRCRTDKCEAHEGAIQAITAVCSSVCSQLCWAVGIVPEWCR